MSPETVPQQFYLTMGKHLEDCPIGVAVVTRDVDSRLNPGDRIFANLRLAHMFGFEDVESFTSNPIGKSWADQKRLEEFEQLIKKGQKVINFEAERIRRDGSRWWALLNSQPITVDNKNFTLVWHIDISERKKAQEELHFRGEIFDSMSEGVAVVETTHQTIVYTNSVFETIFGYEANEMIGLPVVCLNAPTGKSSENVTEDIMNEIERRGKWSGEIKNVRKDGSPFWCHVNVTPFIHPVYGQSNICVQTDITLRKDAEFALKKASLEAHDSNEALKRKTRELSLEIEQHKKTEDSLRQAKISAEAANQAKSDFLAHMSHELRTPLNAIIGFSDMIQNEIFGKLNNDMYLQYVGDIRSSGYHLLQVINDVLDISKIEAGEQSLDLRDFELDELLRSSLRMVKGRRDSQNLTFNYISPDITVSADYRLLKQLVLNILSNAIKYNRDGGKIDVAAKENTDRSIVIIIKDNGIGIDKEDLKKILTPFGQARSGTHITHEGTGLGLSLSKLIAELHEGTLTLESEKDAGTTVEIWLPPERNCR